MRAARHHTGRHTVEICIARSGQCMMGVGSVGTRGSGLGGRGLKRKVGGNVSVLSGCFESGGDLNVCLGRYVPHDKRKKGSVSLTMGNRRRFCKYITWLNIARAESLNGKRSTRQRSNCRTIMEYMRRVRSFLLITECSSTNSER